MGYLQKSYALIVYYFKHVSYNTYEIVSIDKCELPGNYVVNFTHLANKKCFSKSIIDLYNDHRMLDKFGFEDAIKIGNYYAKSLYEKSKFKE